MVIPLCCSATRASQSEMTGSCPVKQVWNCTKGGLQPTNSLWRARRAAAAQAKESASSAIKYGHARRLRFAIDIKITLEQPLDRGLLQPAFEAPASSAKGEVICQTLGATAPFWKAGRSLPCQAWELRWHVLII